MKTLKKRGIQKSFQNNLDNFQVIILEGPRRCGKSTFGRMMLEEKVISSYIDFLNPQELENFSIDPQEYILNLKSPIFIDEAQLYPNILLTIKRIIDRSNIKIILTGSMPLERNTLGGTDPLVGRSISMRLFPLTISEKQSVNKTKLYDLLENTKKIENKNYKVSKQKMLSYLNESSIIPNATNVTVSNYINGVANIIPTGNAFNKQSFNNAIKYFFTNTAKIINLSTIANDLQLDTKTVKNYISRMKELYIINPLQNIKNTNNYKYSNEKFTCFDVSFSKILNGKNITNENSKIGFLMETLLINEIMAMSYWQDNLFEYYYYNEKLGRKHLELDLIIQNEQSENYAFEFKTGISTSNSDIQSAKILNEKRKLEKVFLINNTDHFAPITGFDFEAWSVPIGYFLE